MIILPDRNIPRARILLPVRDSEWRVPSRAQRKDQFGNENRTQFSITARLHDGHPVWRGWFDDRQDFDAFLWAIANGSLLYERELWRLPTPWWSPDLGEYVSYSFLTTTYITTTSASNQTDSVPSDWNNTSNNIDVIGCGASGGIRVDAAANARAASGGGGGAWARQTNVSLTAGGTATFFLNVGGAQVTATLSGSSSTPGNNGPDAWYGSTSTVLAKGGTGGTAGNAAAGAPGQAGGAAGSCVGSSANSGGASGSVTTPTGTTSGTSGGGGAGGQNGAGNAGGSITSITTSTGTAGGSGDAGSGGAGGAQITVSGAGNPGVAGTEYNATHGSGGGGGGGFSTNGGGLGGNYGAGGGGDAGAAVGGTAKSGGGAQGMIVKQYTPGGGGGPLPSSILSMIGVG